MADKVLSQEEIDALMKGVSNGDIDTEGDEFIDMTGVKFYDITSQERVVRYQGGFSGNAWETYFWKERKRDG